MHPEMAAALAGGATVLTANRRLARTLRREYDVVRREAGDPVWREADILPFDAWLTRQWRRALYSGNQAPLLLNDLQEGFLWRQAVATSTEAGQLLQIDATAETARQAWSLLQQYRLPQTRAQFAASEDTAAFHKWTRDYLARRGRLDATDAACLADVVRDLVRGRAAPVPEQVWLTGFAEFTPQQEELLRELEEHGCDAVRSQSLDIPTPDAYRMAFPDTGAELYAAARWCLAALEKNPQATIGVVVQDLGSEYRRVERIFTEVLRRGFHVSLGPPLAGHSPVHGALRLLETYEAQSDPEAPASPSQWSATFAGRLKDAGWPGIQALSSGEFQAMERWRALLESFATLDLVAPGLSRAEALGMVRRLAETTPFQVEDPGCPIQVLGMLEASGSRFDHLWITGMQEEAWPQPSSPNPFLPLALQRARNLPHCSAQRELVYARAETSRLLASSGEVMVSYPLMDGEKPLGPSPLVAHLPARAATPAEKPWYLRPTPLDTFADEVGPPLADGALAVGGTRVLKYQAMCPFRAFAETRLHAEPMEEPELGLDPMERGSILHKALEGCWNEIETLEALRDATEPELAAVVRRSIESALPAADDSFTEKFHAVEMERLERLILAWLEKEKARETPFQARTEQKRTVEIGGLRLGTRADRVDELQDGRFVLIDYKSNAPSPATWDGARPDEPQLPLYAVTSEGPVAAVAFAHLHPGEEQFKGRAASPDLLPGVKAIDGLSQLMDGWKTSLERLALDYRAGRAEVDPKKRGTCQYCHLHSLCRVLDPQ